MSTLPALVLSAFAIVVAGVWLIWGGHHELNGIEHSNGTLYAFIVLSVVIGMAAISVMPFLQRRRRSRARRAHRCSVPRHIFSDEQCQLDAGHEGPHEHEETGE